MADLVKAVEITAALMDVRKSVDRLYGARALEELKPFMEVLKDLHEDSDIPYLELGRTIAKGMQREGLNPMMVLAAMVELIEPSRVQAGATHG